MNEQLFKYIIETHGVLLDDPNAQKEINVYDPPDFIGLVDYDYYTYDKKYNFIINKIACIIPRLRAEVRSSKTNHYATFTQINEYKWSQVHATIPYRYKLYEYVIDDLNYYKIQNWINFENIQSLRLYVLNYD